MSFEPYRKGEDVEAWLARFSSFFSSDPNIERLLSGAMQQKALPPLNVTTDQRDAIADPPTGMLVFNTTTGVHNFWNGTAWGAV